MKFLLDLLAAIFKRPAPAAAPVPGPAPDVPASDQLVRMVAAAGCAPDRAAVVADAFAHAFERFGVTDRMLVQAHILAHCAHESGNFTYVRENLNYSSVARIRAVFGNNRGIARLSDAEVEELVNNPVVLANIVYDDANRAPGYKLGNTQPVDGWKFRGWSWGQLTGRAIIEKLAARLGISADTLINMTDPATFAHAAVWFAMEEKPNFADAAERDNIVLTTKAWQGGQIGLEDRIARRERIRQQVGV